MSTMWSTCSMSTGHCSTQAPQVVHDHSTSGSITPPSSAVPTSGRPAWAAPGCGTRQKPDSGTPPWAAPASAASGPPSSIPVAAAPLAPLGPDAEPAAPDPPGPDPPGPDPPGPDPPGPDPSAPSPPWASR